MKHLRYAGLPLAEQQKTLESIIRADPVMMDLLQGLVELDLPDWLLVSGAIYNNVWNYLTARPSMTGVKDFDVFYFDDSDLSYGAEDVVIKRAEQKFTPLPLPVEVRNQARVHLWAPQKFGHDFPALSSSSEMMGKFASKTHAVGIRMDNKGQMHIVAPFGLDDIFSFRVVPNHVLANRSVHEKKGARAKKNWPELIIEPW